MEWQLTFDCASPARMVAFWAEALGYRPKPPPEGFTTWRDYYLSLGIPADELNCGDCCDRLVHPEGQGPAIWFQVVPEGKVTKNRLHLDLLVGGGRQVPLSERRSRVDGKVASLLTEGATTLRSGEEGDHYYVVLQDPEGNEFCVA